MAERSPSATFRRSKERIQLVFSLGMHDLVEDLTTEGRTRDDQSLSFAWNLLLLRDEAKRLQIVPTADQIRNAEKALSQFQTNDQFDPAKYQQFVDAALKPNGFTAADLDDVVADNLRYAGVSQLVEGSSPLPEAMFKQQYDRLNQKMSLAIIRFNRADFESSVQVTDAEIQKYYDQHKDTILSPEKRKIELVSFLLTDDQKKLSDEQKIAAKKPLAERQIHLLKPLCRIRRPSNRLRKKKVSGHSDRAIYAGTTGQGFISDSGVSPRRHSI